MSLDGNAFKSKLVREAAKAAATPLFAPLGEVLQAGSVRAIIGPRSGRNASFLPCAAAFRDPYADEVAVTPVR
jgi:hypothetical protein